VVGCSREVAQRDAGEEAAQQSTQSPYYLTWSPAQQGCSNGALQCPCQGNAMVNQL